MGAGTHTSVAKATRAAIIQTQDKTTGPTFPAGLSDIPSVLRDNCPCEGRTGSAPPPDWADPGAGTSWSVCAGEMIILSTLAGSSEVTESLKFYLKVQIFVSLLAALRSKVIKSDFLVFSKQNGGDVL